MTDTMDRLVAAALPHVAFDGWGAETFAAAVADSGVSPDVARALCPRGAVDLAIAAHQAGDAAMVAALAKVDLGEMRIRDRIAFAVLERLKAAGDKEAVRRASSLFALPIYAADGAKLIWGTADAIWEALGDPSRDVNWYTKRATLSGVYGSVVLFWLGDTSEGGEATRAFLDRRIEDVMRIETVKAKLRDAPVLGKLMAGPLEVLSRVKAPVRAAATDLPGYWPETKK